MTIVVNDLEKKYKKHLAVKGISFEAEEGECFTFNSIFSSGTTD